VKQLALPVLLALLCVAQGAAAQEGPSAQQVSLDLDGDGRPETVQATAQPAKEDSLGGAFLLEVTKDGSVLYQRLLEECYFEDFHQLPLKAADGGALLCYTCSSGANFMYTDCLARVDGRFRHYGLPGFLNTSPDAPADLNGDGRQDFALAACYSVGTCASGRENELYLTFDGREFSPLIPGGFFASHLVDLDGGGLLVLGLRSGLFFDAVELWGAAGGRMVLLRSVLLPPTPRDDLGMHWQDPPEAPIVGKSLRDSKGFHLEYDGLAFQVTATQASLEATPYQRLGTPARFLGRALNLLFPALGPLFFRPEARQ
jgi:hypothetical protein